MGSTNVAVGNEAGRYATGSYNTFMGYYAGRGGNTSAPYSSGQYNVAVGYQALDSISTATSVTAIGSSAGGSITSCGSNTFIGQSAGGGITTQTRNVAIGDSAGRQLGYGNNVIVGDLTLVNKNIQDNSFVKGNPMVIEILKNN